MRQDNANENSSPPNSNDPATSNDAEPHRRAFLEKSGTSAMVCGLAAGYGALGYCSLRFLLPDANSSTNLGWQYVATLPELEQSDSRAFTSASGARMVITRTANDGETVSYIALSSVCPHLGCQVFWEAVNERFFCPCHNGAFDRTGKATAGPPATARQSLNQFQTRIENGALYVLAPLKTVTGAPGSI